MANQSDAEFNMMFMLKNMDLDQQGQVSSEDRLFMASNPRVEPQRPQVNPFGAVQWEQGKPVYQVCQVVLSIRVNFFLFSASTNRSCFSGTTSSVFTAASTTTDASTAAVYGATTNGFPAATTNAKPTSVTSSNPAAVST